MKNLNNNEANENDKNVRIETLRIDVVGDEIYVQIDSVISLLDALGHENYADMLRNFKQFVVNNEATEDVTKWQKENI